MQTEKIVLPIEVIDGATQPSKEIGKSLEDVGKAGEKGAQGTKKMSMSMTELASTIGVAQKALQALKKGYDFAKEGAQIDFTKVKFDRLAQTIGTTGDALLKKLGPATRGTMSDMELIASATDTMSLGLVKNERDAVRLSTVMAGLGMDMNQVVLALSNQTTMRFDQLNVAVDGFDERLKRLKESGMDTNSAFTEAFLQQAEDQLKKVGNVADEGAGQFMKLESAWKNLVDNFKQGFATAVLPMVEGINESNDAMSNFANTMTEAGVALETLNRNQLRQLQTSYENNELTGHVAAQVHAYRLEQIQAARDAENWGYTVAAVTQNATMTQQQFNDSMKDLSFLMAGDLSNAQEDYAEKVAKLQAELAKAPQSKKEDIIAQIQAETDAYNERATAIMFNIQQQAILGAAESGQIDYSQASQAISSLAESYGMIDEKQKMLMDGTQMLIDQFSQSGNVEGFVAGLNMLTEASIETAPAIDESTSSAQKFNQRLEKTIYWLSKLPESGTAWNYTFNMDTGNAPPGGVNTTSGGMAHDATGGSLGAGWTVVGERGYEFVSPTGHVYTHSQSRAMERGGLRPWRGFADAGDLEIGGGGTPRFVLGGVTRGSAGRLGTISRGGGGSMSEPSITSAPSAAVSAISANVTQQVNAQTAALTTQITNGTNTTNMLLQQLVDKTSTASDIGNEVYRNSVVDK